MEMIVKCLCSKAKESWRYYEADSVQSTAGKFDDWSDDGSLNLIDGPGINEEYFEDDSNNSTERKSVTRISFKSKDGTSNNIYTENAAFLLNDSGETIDRLC